MGASAFNSAYPPQVVDGLGGSALGKHQSCGWPLSPTHRTVVRVHGSPVMTRLHAPREVFGCTQTPVHHTIVSFSSTSLVHSALGIPHRLLRLRHRASSAAHRCGVAGWLTGLRIQARRRGGMPGGSRSGHRTPFPFRAVCLRYELRCCARLIGLRTHLVFSSPNLCISLQNHTTT